ncbi:MAG TPA: histidine--tRNA ligase [Rhabdochlamydiaceae bacterium]|nr:histidine--tRNA ligase [Rhabdochlamydiaceae bacterium]
MHYTIPKGVFDILPQELHPDDQWRSSDRWQYLESIIRQTAHDYDFKEIRTPIFERTELFIRGVGESSDIVSKEMYTFLDKAERSMSLRPEGTAPVLRAFVEKHLYNQQSLHKLYYIGPMFRYERPQAGRYRQHHQFGVEAIGIGKPEQDVEVIDMLCELYRRLGLTGLSVVINSVGDSSSRASYKEKLTQYLTPHFKELSSDSQERFSKNILRILDSKDPNDQKILERAPSILDSINDECIEHFEKVKQLLDKIGIHYSVDPKLVRGLDYYNKTVFEVVWGNLGAQNSIGGGGRYDGLISSLGGPDLPAVGYATGLERILQTMDKQKVAFPSPPHPVLFLIPIGESAKEFCFELLCQLRHEQLAVDIDLSGKKLQHGLQQANAVGAEFCLIIGDDEIAIQKAKIKNLSTRDSVEIAFSELVLQIKNLQRKSHV